MLHKIFTLNNKFHKNFNEYNLHTLYKDLLNFCTIDLSSFYFDIRKDTLYCDPIESEKRKNCLTVLNIIINCLLKWFAPILTFTTEEIYQIIKKERNSIHLESFPKIPQKWENKLLKEKWDELIRIRNTCNISIEAQRSDKIIGSSLEARIELKLKDRLFNKFKNFNFEELLITSSVKVLNDNNINEEVEVFASKASGKKCPVCWKIREEKCERHS